MVPYPCDAISDDYPIFTEIAQIIKALAPLQVELHHIQGHQDTKSDKPLTIPEKINIDCNARESKMGKYHQEDIIQQNPRNPSSYPHLLIQGKVVIRHPQHTLCNASQSPAYLTYLQDKFTWPSCPSKSIQWQILQLTITRFKQSEWWTITKFIQKWPPLQDHYHVKSLSVKQLCPSCQAATETAQHFLACTHTNQQKIWKELHEALQKHAIHHNIDNSLHNLLAYGLYQGCQGTAPFSINQSTRAFPQIYHEQTQLGWKQLFYGRYSTNWSASCSSIHPNINSTHYYAKCLTHQHKPSTNGWPAATTTCATTAKQPRLGPNSVHMTFDSTWIEILGPNLAPQTKI